MFERRTSRISCISVALLLIFGSGASLFGLAAAEQQRTPVAVDLGTTLVAIKYKGGVVLAADTRTSVSSYVSHRYADKIVPVVPQRCWMCRSGSAADTQRLADMARLQFEQRNYRYGISPSVSQVAHFVKSQTYDSGKSASLIVAGVDPDGTSRIFTVSPSGALLEEDSFASAGSGSTYVLGYLDNSVSSQSSDISESEAVELCKRSVELAIRRDGSSGGVVRIFVCSVEGSREITHIPS